jgi:hypothetical protein
MVTENRKVRGRKSLQLKRKKKKLKLIKEKWMDEDDEGMKGKHERTKWISGLSGEIYFTRDHHSKFSATIWLHIFSLWLTEIRYKIM